MGRGAMAVRIVDAILKELSDRKGFSHLLGGLDIEVCTEMEVTLIDLVRDVLEESGDVHG